MVKLCGAVRAVGLARSKLNAAGQGDKRITLFNHCTRWLPATCLSPSLACLALFSAELFLTYQEGRRPYDIAVAKNFKDLFRSLQPPDVAGGLSRGLIHSKLAVVDRCGFFSFLRMHLAKPPYLSSSVFD